MYGCSASGCSSGQLAIWRSAASRTMPSYERIRSPWNAGSIRRLRARCSVPSSSSTERGPKTGKSAVLRPGGSPCECSV